MFGVDEEHLLITWLLLFRRLVRIPGSHFLGVDCLLFQCGVTLKEFFHLLDLFVHRIEVFFYLKAGYIFLDVIGAPIGHFASDQVHEASVVVSGCMLLQFGFDIIQTFLQQSAEEVIAYLNFLL